MRVKLTNRVVERLRPKEKIFYVFDEDMKGFGLRVNPTGKIVFIAEKRIKGKTKRITIGDLDNFTLEEARKEAEKFFAKAKKRTSNNFFPTVRYAVQNYIDTRVSIKKKTVEQYKKYFENHIEKDLGDKRIEELTIEEIRAWYHQTATQESKRTPTSRHNSLRLINMSINRLILERRVDFNPFLLLEKQEKHTIEARTDHFDLRYELGALIYSLIDARLNPVEKTNYVVLDWLLFLLLSGLRDALSKRIEWGWVDDEINDWIYIPKGEDKNFREHRVFITPLIFDILRERSESEMSEEYVFSNRTKTGHILDVRKMRQHVYARADDLFEFNSIKNRTSHDYRRTFATILDYIGIRQKNISILLNHSDKMITQKYIQSSTELLRKDMNLVDEFLNRQVLLRVRAEPEALERINSRYNLDIRQQDLGYVFTSSSAIRCFCYGYPDFEGVAVHQFYESGLTDKEMVELNDRISSLPTLAFNPEHQEMVGLSLERVNPVWFYKETHKQKQKRRIGEELEDGPDYDAMDRFQSEHSLKF